jgi:hypothetical protein
MLEMHFIELIKLVRNIYDCRLTLVLGEIQYFNSSGWGLKNGQSKTNCKMSLTHLFWSSQERIRNGIRDRS